MPRRTLTARRGSLNPIPTSESGPRLCEHFKRSLHRRTVLQHIGVLERAGLVIARREGRQRWNYLNAAPVQAIYDRWISSYAGAAVELLARMKREMEAS